MSGRRVPSYLGRHLRGTFQKSKPCGEGNATTQYFYKAPAGNTNGTSPITEVLQSLLQTINGSGATNAVTKSGAANITAALNGTTPFQNIVAPHAAAVDNTPKAYLTVLFFDERFKFVEEGSTYLRVNSADNSNANLTLAGIKAPKNGYVYVYVSNESDEPVYFDNLQVAHNRGRIVEENHYYAFGLKIAGISSRKLAETYEGNVENKYLYNDKELFDDGDLNWYDYGFRNYDAQIGRFTQLDPLTWDYPDLTPYQYSGNDTIANVDLDGLEPKNVVKKLLGSLSDQGINASSKLLEKGANAGKWLVSWIDKGGVAQLKMFASKSASALSTALNIGAKVADVGLDFVPIAGGARDIYRGVRDGNWVQAGIGALSIVADIFTFGGSSVAKGIIKNAVKEGVEAATKRAAKEAVKEVDKVKYIGRLEDLKGIPRNQTLLDDLPNLGSPKANYYQNMSVLRKALRDGYTIKDASKFRPNSELAPTLLRPNRTIGQTFLGAERNLLKNRGLWP